MRMLRRAQIDHRYCQIGVRLTLEPAKQKIGGAAGGVERISLLHGDGVAHEEMSWKT